MTGPELRHAMGALESASGDVPLAAGSSRLSRRVWLARMAGLGMGVASARSLGGASAAGAVVGAARGSIMAAATRVAVQLAGGLDFVQSRQTVLVKPNVCCPRPHPATKSPEVLSTLLELVRARAPGRAGLLQGHRRIGRRGSLGGPVPFRTTGGGRGLKSVGSITATSASPDPGLALGSARSTLALRAPARLIWFAAASIDAIRVNAGTGRPADESPEVINPTLRDLFRPKQCRD